MSEFHTWQKILPTVDDQVLVVRGRRGTRASIRDLLANVQNPAVDPFEVEEQSYYIPKAGLVPPDEGFRWTEIDPGGAILGYWQLMDEQYWVSEQMYQYSAWVKDLDDDDDFHIADQLPCIKGLYISRFWVRATAKDHIRSGDRVSFRLRVSNAQNQPETIATIPVNPVSKYQRLQECHDEVMELIPRERIGSIRVDFYSNDGKKKFRDVSVGLGIREFRLKNA